MVQIRLLATVLERVGLDGDVFFDTGKRSCGAGVGLEGVIHVAGCAFGNCGLVVRRRVQLVGLLD